MLVYLLAHVIDFFIVFLSRGPSRYIVLLPHWQRGKTNHSFGAWAKLAWQIIKAAASGAFRFIRHYFYSMLTITAAMLYTIGFFLSAWVTPRDFVSAKVFLPYFRLAIMSHSSTLAILLPCIHNLRSDQLPLLCHHQLPGTSGQALVLPSITHSSSLPVF
jgi:hypothetical protein